MTDGVALSAEERERESVRSSEPRDLVSLGRARPSTGEHECTWVGHACCWAEQGRSEAVARAAVFGFFFFFKYVDSSSFCLFQIEFF
jgi:hypothetical protein